MTLHDFSMEIHEGAAPARPISRRRRAGRGVRFGCSIGRCGALAAAEVDVPLDTYLDASHLPKATLCYPMLARKSLPRCVKWAEIATLDQAKQYARRFFHGAVRHGLRYPKGAPVRALWADAARLYVSAHADAELNVEIGAIVEMLAAADQKSATALALEKKSPPPPTSATAKAPPVLSTAGKKLGIGAGTVALATGAGLLAFWALRAGGDDGFA